MTKNKLFGIIGFILLTVGMVFSVFWKKKLRKLPQTYVIGEITRISKVASSGYKAEYVYKIGDQQYSNSTDLGYYYGKVFRRERYIVSIPEGHPEHGFIILACLVSDELVVPEGGWKAIPVKCSPEN